MIRYLAPFIGLLFVVAPPDARAGNAFNQIVVFGDSLSDTGNVYSVLNKTYLVPPNYTTGRFTDGADTMPASKNNLYNAGGTDNVIWHEQLAKTLGVPIATPSLQGGNNYAYGGATTGVGTTVILQTNTIFGQVTRTVNNMGQQVTDYLKNNNNAASAKALYILWGGGNDLRNVFYSSNAAVRGLNVLTNLTVANVVNAAMTAAQNINGEIMSLIKQGATQFLWPNLPPINLTPKFLAVDNMKLGDGTTIGDDLAKAVAAFNAAEMTDVAALKKLPGIKVALMDDFTTVNTIITNVTKNGSYNGYTNVTGIAQGMKVDPDKYLFWDDFHPTVHGEYDLAQLASQSLITAGMAMPEPSAIILLMTGAVGIGVLRLRTGRRQRIVGRGRSRRDPVGPRSAPRDPEEVAAHLEA